LHFAVVALMYRVGLAVAVGDDGAGDGVEGEAAAVEIPPALRVAATRVDA
jgi:hypothetical protein